MTKVVVKEGEPFEKALKRFKKKVEAAGILKEVRRREHYLKPGSLLRIVLSAPVQAYLLGDPWTTGPRLLACPSLKTEADRRRGPEVLDAFLDLAVALRRFELVSQLRDLPEDIVRFFSVLYRVERGHSRLQTNYLTAQREFLQPH